MAAVDFTTDDLAPFATIAEDKAEAMIEDALAIAARVAPCITSDDLSDIDAAAFKAILRAAVLRWNEAGTGAYEVKQENVGPFGQSLTMDTRTERRSMFWPSEIEQMQDICQGDDTSGAFEIDSTPSGSSSVIHADICALNFGGQYCSCGAVLTGLFPLYEVNPSGW